MKFKKIFFSILLMTLLASCQYSSSSSSEPIKASPPTSDSGTPNSPSNPSPSTSPSGEISSDCQDLRENFQYKDIVEKVCVLVNEERAKAGASALKLDSALSNVSQAYAQDMVARNFFSHTSPEGLSPGDRITAAGIHWSTWGENIAYDYSTPETVMNAWMNSAGHKANILNIKYGKIGIGYFQNYWVQDFTN